ncbi:response regulator transcription factor [Streptomyces sp. GESEQ-4]|uniref:response regulator n=1 Tax=Streptomyces sp. GESEQ-4 TaxID=2812655 RepID=UPI0027DE141E|nr:response regulator transcription factor [Streptomyces sp. GESEQ-4]
MSTSATPSIRVLLADDHPVVRDGLAAQPDLTVVGEAATGAEAVRRTASLAPDVVLMDLQMPGMDGTAATAAIRAAHPEVRVLVLTTYDTDADITAAIDAGAVGYLLKDTGRHELCEAVRTAARGGAALSPSVAAKVLAHLRGDRSAGLAGRELEVLSAVARGQSNKPAAHLHQARRRRPHRRRHRRTGPRNHPHRLNAAQVAAWASVASSTPAASATVARLA